MCTVGPRSSFSHFSVRLVLVKNWPIFARVRGIVIFLRFLVAFSLDWLGLDATFSDFENFLENPRALVRPTAGLKAYCRERVTPAAGRSMKMVVIWDSNNNYNPGKLFLGGKWLLSDTFFRFWGVSLGFKKWRFLRFLRHFWGVSLG